METPLLGISGLGDDDMRITMDVRSPLANTALFKGLVELLKGRLEAVRKPSPGDLEMASWSGPGDAEAQEGGTE